MKVIRQGVIPFGRFAAINLFGVLFVKCDVKLTPELINHEAIHSRQIWETGFIFFYLLYFIEWLWHLVTHRFDSMKAYRAISFEREAYSHMNDLTYLEKRKRYGMWRC